MADYLVKSLIDGGMFRAYVVDATETVTEAQQRHDTWSAATAALGRTLIGTMLLSTSLLKGDEKLTVKVNGHGPVGAIVVDGNANGTVKGYLQYPHTSLPLNEKHKIDVKKAVGVNGMLTVTKDQGLGQPYTGQVPLVSGELGEDFTYYLAKSEQIPSAVGVSVFVQPNNTVKVAGGFLIQVMPGASDEAIARLEQRIKEMPMVSELLLAGQTPEEILALLFKEERIKIVQKMPVGFKCDCSKDRFAQSLASIQPAALQEMIDEDHGAEAVCHFCGTKYQFSEDDLRAILTEAQAK
ncbi:Hsp33 family molecular chaperone HslO [Levilactobacillus brevis]|uniref:33 kDa chaperonin n=1 Tax=Levilactobacillus brevis TaxID=1580 RepID=A0AB38X466_LEVBR|nr:Hsp33 family molecular chaperone HslO [Levilactobacillus brevis]KLE29283.1 molecular chaperone Hsp33 [Levilactobacillus brevis]MBT9676651.1 Hsp33 family molecular chaperone HslO [Levilactobacillus brevis]MBY7145691.1 Hsp33 family molecular chaperone HslO [Levilactobacillus brevis]MCP9613964.1 Hsp33 family molecular chaperone HslO [Levilactobacillus brevis]MCT3569684.1 redox-regulated molecular chaperone Hsp33 [Levilactobacillus brevis]